MKFKARFFSGESLEATAAVLDLRETVFEIRSIDGRILFSRPSKDACFLFADKSGDRVDIGVIGEKDYRIIVEAPEVRDILTSFLPQIAAAPRGQGWGFGLKISAGLVGFMLLLGVAVWQLERIVPALIPDEYARDMGLNIANEYIEETGGQCKNAKGTAALQLMVNRLVGSGGGARGMKVRDLTVRVADSPTVNAFAVPGGQIVLFRGLIKEASSADEVAGVLAHEIGHVYHKHPLRGLTRSVGLSIITTLFSGSNMSELTQQLIVSGFSRSMESDADMEALQMLGDANIDPEPLAGFFQRLAEKYDGNLMAALSFVSTHPASGERAEKIRLGKRPDKIFSPVLNAEQWQALQNICPKVDKKDADKKDTEDEVTI